METCGSCLKPKAALACGLCGCDLCKQCAQILDEGEFSFLKAVPAELAHSFYCANCFAEKIAPEVERYTEVLERAKGIIVFEKSQGKETRLIKRKEAQLKVSDCDDYDETLMRLAFFAAEAGHNAIVDVDINGRKIKNGSYQSTKFSGTATPVTVDPRRYDSDRPELSNPN
jgi:hypothetical protein